MGHALHGSWVMHRFHIDDVMMMMKTNMPYMRPCRRSTMTMHQPEVVAEAVMQAAAQMVSAHNEPTRHDVLPPPV
jgi:hypothetical protein